MNQSVAWVNTEGHVFYLDHHPGVNMAQIDLGSCTALERLGPGQTVLPLPHHSQQQVHQSAASSSQ